MIPLKSFSSRLGRYFFLFVLVCFTPLINAEERTFAYSPTSYKGRFSPYEAYSRVWLYDFYHAKALKKPKESAHEFLLHYYFKGHAPFNEKPLFWIYYSTIKEALQLNPKQDRFSLQTLKTAIFDNEETNLNFINPLIINAYLEASQSRDHKTSSKIELSNLEPGLWVGIYDNDLVALQVPNVPLFRYLKPQMVIEKDFVSKTQNFENSSPKPVKDSLLLLRNLKEFESWNGAIQNPNAAYINLIKTLQKEGIPPEETYHLAEKHFPLKNRLLDASSLLKMLPSLYENGEWVSLHALKIKVYDPRTNRIKPIKNFTLYSEEQFEKIRRAYLDLVNAFRLNLDPEEPTFRLGKALNEAYQSIASLKYLEDATKSVAYPTENQLKVEVLYYQLPLIEMAIVLYLIAAILLLLYCKAKKRAFLIFSLFLLGYAFFIHTLILAARWYILERPPVSNMFETIIYVPWVSIAASFVFWHLFRNAFILVASAVSAIALLILILLTNITTDPENLQAVLNSHYWLTLHVLMVVGSYGLFVLAGVLGHIFLIKQFFHSMKLEDQAILGQSILQTLYLGIALLIPGTILGAVWASESWGRFWDWDPKESWAFISCCIYLLWIHAYTFHRISFTGIAVGSIIGLMAISFTWYGVNYILGTGLHSYGFGSGGETYYYAFLLFEALFLLAIAFRAKITLKTKRKA